jgi:hypothetical protein
MQPPTNPESSTVNYQVPRNVIIGILWRRVVLRPIIIYLSVGSILAVICFFLGKGAVIAGSILIAFVVIVPLVTYAALAKAVDNNPTWTDRRTLEFNTAGVIATGTNWKSEFPWARFLGFSEDDRYFYLHLSRNGITSIIPKAAFAPEQQEKFREYARSIPAAK